MLVSNKAMKHHLYQIYYGGWKIKLKDQFYCSECDKFYYGDKSETVARHKKQFQNNYK